MKHLNILNRKLDFSKDLEKIRALSKKIDDRISQSNNPDDSKIEKLSLEELQDINKILGLANFLLYKYEEKKETRSILQYFVSIIDESSKSIEGLDDEISELIMSAEDSINKLKDANCHISEKCDLRSNNGSINLTNFTTEINTVGYQVNSQENTE